MKDYFYLKSIDEKVSYLKNHNKNYTQSQEWCIDDLYDYIKELKQEKNNNDRIIVLRDWDEGDLYVETNAPEEEIRNAIDYKDNARENGNEENYTDFEIMQQYLEEKGYYLDGSVELEIYGW